MGLGIWVLTTLAVVACGDDGDPQTAPDASAGGRATGSTPGDGGTGGGGTGGGGTGGSKGGAGGGGGRATGGDGPETGVPLDGNDCSLCTKDLSRARSLECYCGAHDCIPTLREALDDLRWGSASTGCGYVYLRTPGGVPPTAWTHLFDATTGKLVGAATWNDIAGACISPTDSHGTAAGGPIIDVFEGSVADLCPDPGPTSYCLFHPLDGGAGAEKDSGADGAAIPQWPVCDKTTLLGRLTDGGIGDGR